jgi:glycerol uptake facilitator-like aquaporin
VLTPHPPFPQELEAGLLAANQLSAVQFTPQGPAGIFGLYAPPQSNLAIVFWNEFSCDFVLGLAIWGCLDPTNIFAPPAAIPFVVGLTYATVIWGFSPIGCTCCFSLRCS